MLGKAIAGSFSEPMDMDIGKRERLRAAAIPPRLKSAGPLAAFLWSLNVTLIAPDNTEELALENVARTALLDTFQEMLSPRERCVLESGIMLWFYWPRAYLLLERLANALNGTSEHIRQIEAKALGKLRTSAVGQASFA